MTGLLLAIQFLSVIPLKIRNVNECKLADSLVYFPAAGLLIGLVLSGLSAALFSLHFYGLTVAVVLTAALAALTGGIHLDGLSDTFDALASGKDKEKCLEIMRDAHAGAMGLIAIVCALLLKAGFIFSLRPQDYPAALILMCVLSRWSLVGAMFFFPYARSKGKAGVYMNNINRRIFLSATLIAVCIAVLAWQLKGVLLFALAGAVAWSVSKIVSRKINGITGDTLGAINEFVEIAVLAGAGIIGATG